MMFGNQGMSAKDIVSEHIRIASLHGKTWTKWGTPLLNIANASTTVTNNIAIISLSIHH